MDFPRLEIRADALLYLVDSITRCLTNAIVERGVAHIVLAGGSSYIPVYDSLVTSAQSVDWSSVEVWFGDERCVAPYHELSNYRTAHDTLLSNLDGRGIPRVHRIQAELGITKGMQILENELHEKGEAPLFDIVLLGVGQDGHVASIFPSSLQTVLQGNFEVLSNYGFFPPHVSRISMGFQLLNRSRYTVVYAPGNTKRAILALARLDEKKELPISHIYAEHGETIWLTDTTPEYSI